MLLSLTLVGCGPWPGGGGPSPCNRGSWNADPKSFDKQATGTIERVSVEADEECSRRRAEFHLSDNGGAGYTIAYVAKEEVRGLKNNSLTEIQKQGKAFLRVEIMAAKEDGTAGTPALDRPFDPEEDAGIMGIWLGGSDDPGKGPRTVYYIVFAGEHQREFIAYSEQGPKTSTVVVELRAKS